MRRKKYKALEIDFKLPELLQEDIDNFVRNLNEKSGSLADCYEQEIRNVLNGCDDTLEEGQIALLREYYVKGGIYKAGEELPEPEGGWFPLDESGRPYENIEDPELAAFVEETAKKLAEKYVRERQEKEPLLMAERRERLWHAIEEAARLKVFVTPDYRQGDAFSLTMVDEDHFVVEDVFWENDKGEICRAVLEAGMEKRGSFMIYGLRVCGCKFKDGSYLGRTTVFRRGNRYIPWDAHEQDNIPNPFEDLTLEELYFLREHRNLLEKMKP